MAYLKFLLIVFLMFSSESWAQTYKPSDLRQIFQEHRDNAANFAIIYRGRQFNGVMKITEIKESDFNPRSNTAFHIRLENENKLRLSCYAKTKDEIKNISMFKVGQKVIVTGVMNRAYQPSLLSLDQCLFVDPKYDLEQYCKSNKVYENGVLKSCFGVANFQPCNGFHCNEKGKTTGLFERKNQSSDLSFGDFYISENGDGTRFDIVIQQKTKRERYIISYEDVRKEVGEERIQFFKERDNAADGYPRGFISGTVVEAVKKKNKWAEFKYVMPCKENLESTNDWGYVYIGFLGDVATLPAKYHENMKGLIASVLDFIRDRRSGYEKTHINAQILSIRVGAILDPLQADPDFALSLAKMKEQGNTCDYKID
jgi:hypothetical protein